MHTNEPREAPDADMGFEVRDVNMPIIGKVVMWFFVFDILCYAVIAAWYIAAKPQLDSKLDPRKHMTSLPILLESNISVRTDIQDLRQAETKALSTSKRNDDGTYTIPIERAMDLIAQRGLPHVVTNTPAVSPGNTIPQNALPPGSRVYPNFESTTPPTQPLNNGVNP